MAQITIILARTMLQIAMEQCMCIERLPICLLNADGTRCALQPHIYGGL